MITNIENPIIKAENLTKVFSNSTVLNNFSIEIEKNSITTILGFSGAGKSTLIKHFLGLLFPTSGTLEILGKRFSDFDRFELREFRKNFGMVFQYAALF